jgi:hypothetical protein
VATHALQHCTLLFAYTFHNAFVEPYDLPEEYEQAFPKPFGVMDSLALAVLSAVVEEYNWQLGAV